jgi:ubiquinone/menaquinone biosynthesis C-methylase UbiE
MSDEAKRIQERYRERDAAKGETGFWTFHNPVVLHIAQERERVFWQAARELEIDLSGIDILDVGAGGGGELFNLCRWGASANRMFGIDLSWERVRRAHKAHHLNILQANGTKLPFRDGQFGAVVQNVVFSSIISSEMRQNVAEEMNRVLAPGGMLLWYDARRCRGNDPNFLPVPQHEVEQLFPKIKFTWYNLTTDVGLLRLVEQLGGEPAMRLMDALRIFRTHLFGVGTKLTD